MAQALEKSECVFKSGENVFFCTENGYTFPKFSFWRNPVFSKVFDNRKKQPLTLSRQVLVKETPIISCCYYKPPKCGIAVKRRYRKKKIKFWRRGRAVTGAHMSKMKAQDQTFQTRYSSFLWYA